MSAQSQTHWNGVSRSVDQTLALGAALGKLCRPGDLVGLIGLLGAGKTHLVRGMAAGMGMAHAPVTSPTFVMIQEYESADEHNSDSPSLIHVDAYRLGSAEDLESIGWDFDAAELRQNAIVVVEWADRLAELCDDALTIEMIHRDDQQRQLIVTAAKPWTDRMPQLIDRFDDVLKTHQTG